MRGPAWIPCPQGCGSFWCTIHHSHVHDCDCPGIEHWAVDPYQEGGYQMEGTHELIAHDELLMYFVGEVPRTGEIVRLVPEKGSGNDRILTYRVTGVTWTIKDHAGCPSKARVYVERVQPQG